MNANQIHTGHEYAVCPYSKPNGNAFIPNAIRLVAYRTFGEQEYGNKRLTMYVEGFVLDENGTPISTTYSKFRVRDVIDDWEEYEDRADQHEVEEARRLKEQQDRWQREREEMEQRRRDRIAREEQERLHREQEKARVRNTLNNVIKGLVERGFNENNIYFNETTGNVSIPLMDLKAWLDSLTKVECQTCHRELIMIELPA